MMTNEYLQKIILNPNSSRDEYLFAFNVMQERVRNQDYLNQLPNPTKLMKVQNV